MVSPSVGRAEDHVRERRVPSGFNSAAVYADNRNAEGLSESRRYTRSGTAGVSAIVRFRSIGVIGLPRSFMFGALAAVALAGCGTATVTTTSSTAPAATTTAAISTPSASSTPSATSATSTAAATPPSTQTTPGAGATSVSAFRRGFVVEKARFRTLGSDLAKAVEGAGSKSNAQIAVEFQSLSTRAAEQAVRLAKLHPPAKHRKDLAQLTAAFAAVASDLSTIVTAATTGKPQAARAATIKLVRDATQVKAHDNGLTAALGLPQTR